jgi:3-oxoacyl-[acyl-carrier-protein] synthase III
LVPDSILEIIKQGAWNGGTLVDNSIYSKKGMSFKGGIPVDNKSIEERIGIRTRMVAGPDERIGVIAFQNLLDTSDFDPSRIKILIGATNVGDDKYDPGPLVRYPFELIKQHCPNAIVIDLYAGCPGFNVASELVFMLSVTGVLKTGDISTIIGAENIHRANAFKETDTAGIIFGDDALATALETKATLNPNGSYSYSEKSAESLKDDFIEGIAKMIIQLNGRNKIDGIIIDNQLGQIIYRVPALAARVQHSMVEQLYPEETAKGIFTRFKDALEFYDEKIQSFAFDIMSLNQDPALVNKIARAYVESGKYKTVVSVYLSPDFNAQVTIHEGADFDFKAPLKGIVDTHTSTHGCFGDYIQAISENNDFFGDMDGKGVFLYATRGATRHITTLLARNKLTMYDIDLLVEHQANFAMIPLTLEQVFGDAKTDKKKIVKDFIENKMINNIHIRGNCSVVCMQRLPYDLERRALKEDTLQGFPINRNLDNLRHAKIILNDSVGSGMTRSSILQMK